LIRLVDPELRRLARLRLEPDRGDPILQTTALVNEAYLRLIQGAQVSWRDRAHFFAVCAKIMRHILVDHARARRTAKRGGGSPVIPLDEALVGAPEPAADLVAIDEALQALAKVDGRKGRVVELRFFGGLSLEETAEVLKVSPETVRRDWRLAKVWLLRELSGEPARRLLPG
jgi:RNA polymerase sigma factor (TIGR02999 family)